MHRPDMQPMSGENTLFTSGDHTVPSSLKCPEEFQKRIVRFGRIAKLLFHLVCNLVSAVMIKLFLIIFAKRH
jgi:hypothetical protein